MNEASDSSGDGRAVGSQFQVFLPYAAKQRWSVDVRVQGTRRSAETAERDWLHSALVQCWNGWIITMLHSSPFYNIFGNVSHTLLGSDALQASPPTPHARWTRLVSAPAVVWDTPQPVKRSRGVSAYDDTMTSFAATVR